MTTLEDLILFIDGEGIVIDKPAGLAVDAPRAGGDSIERRAGELTLGFARPPTAMHRLDRDTSGCLLFARTPKARAAFQQSFEAGTVRKAYIAILDGVLDADEGIIDLPLAKISSASGGWRMIAADGSSGQAKSAITHWRRIAEVEGETMVEFRPQTGRTHQIRVHAARGLGAAIVGDPVYARRDDDDGPLMVLPDCGMLLHASRLAVPREKKEWIDVSSPLPDRFGRWLDLYDAG